ncbi:uncharacterized protein LOC135197091 [Macrobrachium nipponense]|uniref:uncharacterized protein LOC135197091 n=1 Tax=Macrobrachium nipponense TaxID=159736 RepID=UPI0030C83A32
MKLLGGVLAALVVVIIFGDGSAVDKPVVPGNIRAKLIKKVKIGNCDFPCRTVCPQTTTPGSSGPLSSPSIKPSVQPSTESSVAQPPTVSGSLASAESSSGKPPTDSSSPTGSSTGKAFTGSSTTPSSTTTAGLMLSLKEEAKSAVTESQTELGGLLADAEQSRMKRADDSTASVISEEIITEFKIKITRWTTDFGRITFPDIREIRNTTNRIRAIRIQIKSGTKSLSNKSISELKATIKVTAIFLGDISKAIDDEKRQDKLASSSKLTKTIKGIVGDIRDKAVSLSKRPVGDSSTVSIDFVDELISRIRITIEMGPPIIITIDFELALSQSVLKLEEVLKNIDTVTFSSKDMEKITKLVSVAENAVSAIGSAVRENERKAAAHEKLLLYKDLLSATDVVQEGLAKITAAKEAVSGTPITSSFTIPADIMEVYSILQTSFEPLTWSHTEKLKSFELVANQIIGLLSTSNVDIIGLENLKNANKELQKRAKTSVDELNSRSSVIAKADITAEAKQSLTDIVQSVKNFKNKTAATGSPNPLAIIESTRSFLSALDPESLSESTITQLQSYATQLAIDLDQALSDSVGVAGIDDILSVAESVLLNINEKLEIISKSKETIDKIETTERVITLLSGFETEVSALSSKFSSSGSQTEASVITEVEDVIVQVTKVLVKFVSKTYTIVEEDIIDIVGYLEQFKTRANQIQSFSEIKGLNQILTLIQTAKEVVQGRQISFTKSFEAKKTLDDLDYKSSFLSELRSYLLTLKDLDSPTLTSGSLVVSEITQQLAFWSEGIFYIRREQVDEVQGYLFTLKSQTAPGDSVKGVSNLLSIVSNLETLLEGAKNKTRQADQDTEGKINLESTYNLLTEAASTFQQLIELTKDFQSSEVTYQVVTKVTEKVAELSKKTSAVTSQEVDEFRAALTELNEFIKSGGVQGKIKGLTEDLLDILDAKKLLQKKIKEDQVDKVDIIKEIAQSIGKTLKLLETVFVDENSVNISEYEFLKSEKIDEFYEFIVRVEEQPGSLGDQDLQDLLTITPEIQYTVSSASEYSIITGYRVNLTTILRKAKDINDTLSGIIVQEETLKRDSEKLSLYSDLGTSLSEIVSSLGRISKLEADSDPNSFKGEFDAFKPILQSLSENLSLFDNPSELLKFLDLLYTIEKSNKKPAGTDSLLALAESTLNSVNKQIEDTETSNLIAVHLQNLNAVSEVTSKIEKELKITLDNISPDKLLGEPNKDIEDTIKFINTLSSNVGSVTSEIILDLAGRLSQITSLLSEPTNEQSAGNLLSLKKSVEKFADNADRYTKDLLDRETVKTQIKDVQSSDEILRKIEEELSKKISTITESDITDSGSSEPEAISGLTSKLKKIFDKSVYEVSAAELNESLNALKNLDVTEGVETPGIFALQSLVKRSVSDLELESQFLKSTEVARKSVDILAASSQYIAAIEDQLQNIINYFRGDKDKDKGSRPVVITAISTLLGKLGDEEVSFSFVKDIETLSKDLKSLDLQMAINTGSVIEALELTRTASYKATQALKDQESISKERQRNVLYERLSGILSQTRETLQTLDSNKTLNGPLLDNEDITQFFSLIKELFGTAEIKGRKIDLLEAVLEKVKRLSSTDLAGKDISGMTEAIDEAGQLEQNIKDELSTSKKDVKLSAKKTTKLEIAKTFDRISSIVTSKLSSIGIATQQIDVTEILDLQKTIEDIDLDAASFEDVSVLKEKVDALEKIVIVEGTGINNLRDLKSTVISKTEITKQSSEVFSAISEVSESSRSLTQINEALSGLEEELSSVTVSSNNQDDNEPTGILSEILEATYIVDLSGLWSYLLKNYKKLPKNSSMLKRVLVLVQQYFKR